MPTETEPFVDYHVATTLEGEYVHVLAEADPDNPRTHRWLWRPYAAENTSGLARSGSGPGPFAASGAAATD